MGRNSRCEGIPGGKDFLVGRNSQCERFPGGRFPGGKEFSVAVLRISRW